MFCLAWYLNAAALHASQAPLMELQAVIPRLAEPSEPPTSEHPRIVSIQELSQIGDLSLATKHYLKDATISIQPFYPLAKSGSQAYSVSIRLANGTATASRTPNLCLHATVGYWKDLIQPLLLRTRTKAALHMLDDIIAELRAFDFGGAFHLAGEIIGDAFGGDRAVQAFDNQIGGFGPAQVAEHHFAAEHDAARD